MEMPRIIEHSKKGMDILPLILRPCAWQIETDLARLQARPELGRALSSGNDYQIDLDLSLFTYELAAKIGSMETAQAIEAKELLQAHGGLAGEAQTRRRPFQQLVGDR